MRLPIKLALARGAYSERFEKDKKLPEVSVHHDYGTTFEENGYEIISDESTVGYLSLRLRENEEGKPLIHFWNIERYTDIDPRKGIGLATYVLFMERYGEQFASDLSLTDDSLNIWNYLTREGVARCEMAPQEVTDPDISTKFYFADFRINKQKPTY